MPETVDSGTFSEDPLVGALFALEIQGVINGYFTECSGLGSETGVTEQKVTTDDGRTVIVKVPGLSTWQDITLKRGITSDMQIWEWRKQVEEGDIAGARHDGSIIMFDQELQPKARWDFTRAWPSRISGPALKADTDEFGIEEIVLVHEGIQRVDA